ncbi:40108_t:CDS:2 [Gigaspora margarita]|uniref:40108_t:CDS:1 n=1 Tax=Gigaspora margarita TaxID=4874 RepID=A0ABN7US71_GIGMA|nr:40108_t:CDS:2 [Gigaspora margarita]
MNGMTLAIPFLFSKYRNMSNWLKIAIEQKYIKSYKHNSFQDLKIIGKGGFGAIYSAYSKDFGQTVALKGLFCNEISSDGFIKETSPSPS